MVRRGLSEKVREKLTTPNERRLATEVLTRRVRHFTHGVIFGSRSEGKIAPDQVLAVILEIPCMAKCGGLVILKTRPLRFRKKA